MKVKVILMLAMVILLANYAIAAGPTAVPTFHCLGIYWSPPEGASNNECQVKYSVSGAGQWKDGYSLWFDTRDSEYRGSIVDLEPGTSYDIELTLLSTSTTETFTALTWSENFPIGQTIYLPETSNQTYNISTSGTASGYVLYTHDPGLTATIDVQKNYDYCIEIPANTEYIIIRDLILRGAQTHGIKIRTNCHDIVIEKCDISDWGTPDTDGFGINYQSAIESKDSDPNIQRIIVQRNTIHNPSTDSNSWEEGGHPGGPQAVALWNTGGNHVIRYNDVYGDPDHYYNDIFGAGSNSSTTAGFPTADTDIYSNHIRHCWDDGIESEGANRNVRIWGNYIDSTYVKIAIAGTAQGPIYIFRNISAVGRRDDLEPWGTVSQGAFLKTGHSNNGGKVYFFHNTFLQPELDGVSEPVGVEVGLGHGGPMYNVMTRNNILHVFRNSKRSIYDRDLDPDGDYDYDLYNGTITAASPYETNGIENTPIYDAANGQGEFALDSSSPGYDDGVVLKNFSDGYTGTGPDMGAFEEGSAPMEFGVDAYSGPPPTQYTLTINTAGSGSVSPSGGTYDEGTIVTLTANPDIGWQFDNWSGDLTGTVNPETITMNADKTVTANFSPAPQYTLTVNTTGSGSVSLDPTGGIYDSGTVVTLTAAPDAGNQFDNWTGDLTGTVNPETITMNADKTVTANFIPIPQYTITMNIVGSGSVSLDPTGGTYDSGTLVTLTASPDAGNQFDNWTGDLTGTVNPETITMDADKTVTANFSELPPVTVYDGCDANIVTGACENQHAGYTGAGYANTDNSAGTYVEWTNVTASETKSYNCTIRFANGGSTARATDIEINGIVQTSLSFEVTGAWTSWSTKDFSVTLNNGSNTFSVVATGADGCPNIDKLEVETGPPPTQYTLTVNTVGSGSVSLNPPGGTYDEGSVVTLTATPDAGNQFDNWTGDLTGTVNPETITMDANKTVTANFSVIQYTLTVNTAGSGSVSLNPPGGTYDSGTIVTLTAAPDAGNQFDNWTGDLTGTVNPESITMDADKTVTADFSVIQYTLIVNTAGSGSVSLNPPGGTYDSGTIVTLTAAPDAGNQFDNWTGDLTGTVNPESITMDANKAVTANFSVIQYTLTVNTSGNGSVSLNPPGGTYDSGTVVTLTASPDAGNQFDNWTGDLIGTVNPETITMDANKTVTANFSVIPQYILTVNTAGSGSVSLDPPGGTYDSGTVVTLTASPDTGNQFDNWTGDLTGTVNPENITMDADRAVTANFSAIPQYTLTVNTAGSGSVSLNPPGGTYDSGTVVTLTASPDAGNQFDNWTGDLTGTVNPETITMDADKTVTANFSEIPTVDVYDASEANIVTGTCDTNNAGYTGACFANTDNSLGTYVEWTNINASATQSYNCTIRYANGVEDRPADIDVNGSYVTTLTFASTGGWTTWLNETFSATLDSGANTIRVTGTTASSCANLDKLEVETGPPPPQYTLTVNTVGSGSVSLNPPGGTYDSGTVVTLTASPDAGNQFDIWTGDLTGTANPETITMDADKTVTANFSAIQYTLTVNTAGPGSVSLDPPGGTYNSGTVVTLTASPDAGNQFDIWTGDLTGTANPETITMDANKTVTANFSVIQYTLTVNTVGSGSVVLDPAGGTYDSGTVVTLTATPDANWSFDNWTGDLTGTVNPATITMDADKTVTANFSTVQYTLTVNTAGSGSVSLNPPGGTYNSGAVVTLTATPDAGNQFDNWTGDLTGTANPETITMDADRAVTANFSAVPQYTLIVNTVGSGSVSLDPTGGTYDSGTVVTLTATPDAGNQFDIWTGDLTGTANPETITMDANKNVTANFSEGSAPPDTIEVRITDNSDDVEERSNGSMSFNSSDLELVEDKSDLQKVGMRFTPTSIPQGATITNAYVQFQCDETSSSATNLTVQGEASDNASVFTTTNGDVSSRTLTSASTAWSNVPAWNTKGEQGPDQRTPDISSVIQEIVNRSGWASSNALVIIITGSGSRTAEAHNGDPSGAPLLHVEYSTGPPPPQYTLTVNTVGSGSVSLDPAGGTYNEGTVVTLTASPDAGNQFDIWTGDLTGTANPETITMDADKAVTANFSQLPQYILTVNTVGSGSVSLDPAGGTYDSGTVVTLTAVPDAGNQFDIWTGDLTGTVNPETITMDADKNVTASFSESTGEQAFQQDSGSDGIVSMEAEHYDSNVSQGGHDWTTNMTSGYSGDSAMEATPNSGTTQNTDYAANSPRMDYKVNFVKTGTHHIWARGIGPSGYDDSYHAGLDGQEISTCDRIRFSNTDWDWSNLTMDPEVATFEVTSTGLHTVNVWMREDGFIIDKIVLTVNASYTPSGTGPAESPRGPVKASHPIEQAEAVEIVIPDELRLVQNYPNPFNPSTNISYSLSEAGHVRLDVYNMKGRLVSTLVDGVQNAGEYTEVWEAVDSNGNQLPNGMYLCRFQVGSHVETIKMMFMR